MSLHRASRSGWWSEVERRGPLRRAAAFLAAGALQAAWLDGGASLAAVVARLLSVNFRAAAQRRDDVLLQHATTLTLRAALLGHTLDTADRYLRSAAGDLREWPVPRAALEARLRSLASADLPGEEPAFDRVVAVDEAGREIAAAGPAGGSATAAWVHRRGAVDRVGLTADGGRVVVVAPVGSKDRPVAHLVGFLSPDRMARALVQEWEAGGRPRHGHLVDEHGVAYSGPALRHAAGLPPALHAVPADGVAVPVSAAGGDADAPHLVARVRLPGRTLWLVDVSRREDLLRGVPTGSGLAALTAVVALALGFAVLGVVLNVRSFVESARQEESSARRREVGEKDQALERVAAERRRAEQARAVLANALEQSAEAVAIADPSLRLGHVNPAFERLSGRPAAEVGGRPYLEAIGADGAGASGAGFLAAAREGRPWRGELPGRRADGSAFEAEVSLTPVRDEQGRLTHHVVSARDVTEQHRERERRRHLQRLEAIGTLAGGVAHDFNNLLTAINGYAALAIDALPPGDPVREDVEEIRRAGARAADLTRQLLAFGRRQVLAPVSLDPGEVVSGVEKMMRRLIGEDVDLATELQPGCWRIRADRGQLEQVLVNLAVNARDAMPDGGRLSISVANVTLGEREARRHPEGVPGDFVRIRVVDTGHGMTPEVMGRIFEPFFTTKEPGKGTGLGLSTVYGIVRQSRGFVGVTSAPGAGTTFEVYLPRETGEEGPARTHAAGAADAEARGEVVLVVEDAEQVRSLLVSQLTARGFAVLAAADGREALELAERRRERIDALVTDVVMPRVSGPELARRLAPTHPEAVVVYMSGYAEEAVLRAGGAAPAGAFIAKPFEVSDLCALLRGLLGAEAQAARPPGTPPDPCLSRHPG
ncbi:MAG TPA: response regulator [Anaeromyxobacteraceae bacterium]|nr:response regulator [Anaeromyxobacteraceae bacterium]